MKQAKRKGLSARIRYESDLVLEILPNPSEPIAFQIKRLRQEARVSLKAVDTFIEKAVKRNFLSSIGLESIQKKFKFCVRCMEEWRNALDAYLLIQKFKLKPRGTFQLSDESVLHADERYRQLTLFEIELPSKAAFSGSFM